jgi:hypothetical protein
MKTVIRIVVSLLTLMVGGFAQVPAPPQVSNSALPAPVSTPRPAVDLTAGHYSYRVANIMGAQRTEGMVAIDISDGGTVWNITQTTDFAVGTAVGTAVLEHGSLAVRRFEQKSSRAGVTIEFAEHKVTGTLHSAAGDKRVSADVSGVVFAEGPGNFQSVACLPLAKDYAITYRNVDYVRQAEEQVELRVLGSESVTVPAGTFDSYIVHLIRHPAETDQTIWIDRKSRKVVKVSTSAPNGPMSTQELLQ